MKKKRRRGRDSPSAGLYVMEPYNLTTVICFKHYMMSDT